MPAKIDLHPHREKIIDAVLAGKSLRKIAKMVGVSHAVVDRYKRHVVIPAMQAAGKIQRLQELEAAGQTIEPVQQPGVKVTTAVATADPLLTRVEARLSVLDRNIPKADKKEDFRGISSLMRADRDYMELYARLTGRLDAPAQSQTNVFIALIPPGAPQPAPQPKPEPAGESYDVELIEPSK